MTESPRISLFSFALLASVAVVGSVRFGGLPRTSLVLSSTEGGPDNRTGLDAGSQKLSIDGSCSDRDISISQSEGTASGIPQYIVQIVNTCVSGCAPSRIHFHCGWFASARMVNPKAFKRLGYDDCLVNGGRPLKNGNILSFSYSNSFMYQLSFKSAKFC
ncbi:hypothetical protein MLD38_038808 [Melastoma candidum]|uniref:Uncharacterized protein n=1 Tax=Melastoma candidum TaxID=119954 RepID=A0ACB9L033_9MYRT|nr:hypothetical protein MLD38_038808 [Melastoma candidum]